MIDYAFRVKYFLPIIDTLILTLTLTLTVGITCESLSTNVDETSALEEAFWL